MDNFWTPERIKRLLTSNDRAVERAIVSLFERQTQDEQARSVTRHTNSRGFRANHASRGSYYACWVKGGRRLTGWHLATAREMALHYAGQLADEANIRTHRSERMLAAAHAEAV